MMSDRPGFYTFSSGSAPGRQLTYEATEDRGKRTAASGINRSEDLELNSYQRRQVSSDVLDLNRNFAVASWAIRRHLDYVATQRFHAITPDSGFNTELEAMITESERPAWCDASGIHPFPRMVRLTEATRVFHGDGGLIGLADGKLQGN